MARGPANSYASAKQRGWDVGGAVPPAVTDVHRIACVCLASTDVSLSMPGRQRVIEQGTVSLSVMLTACSQTLQSIASVGQSGHGTQHRLMYSSSDKATEVSQKELDTVLKRHHVEWRGSPSHNPA